MNLKYEKVISKIKSLDAELEKFPRFSEIYKQISNELGTLHLIRQNMEKSNVDFKNQI